MTEQGFHLISPLIVLYCIVTAVLSYLLIKVPHRYRLKWIGIPVILVAGFFSFHLYVGKLGLPFPTVFPEDEAILLYAIVADDEKTIQLWIKEHKTTSKLIVIPYDEKIWKGLKKTLERGQQSKIPQVIKKKNTQPGAGGHGTDDGYDFESYDFQYEQEMPKDMVPTLPDGTEIPNPVLPQMPPPPSNASELPSQIPEVPTEVK